MSFVISNKQYLAPTEERVHYEPLMPEKEGVKIRKLDMTFGHPLYTTAADILYIESTSDESKHIPIVPDGCISLVFKGYKGNDEPSKGYLCGAIDTIRKLQINPNEYYVIIRFMPGTGYSLIKNGKSANSISDVALPVKGGVVGEEQILSVLERDLSFNERLGLISKIVRVNLQNEPDRYIVKYCTEKIFTSHGNVKIEELAKETGFTARHIGKIFERCVGVSPKLYAQIIKLQTSMSKIIDSNTPLMEIAVDSGFFDHAHMNRMYKKFIKLSTGEFRKTLFAKLDFELLEDYISIDEAQ